MKIRFSLVTALGVALLFLLTGFASAADSHPPVGTIVTASDTGKQMIHTGGGHFREAAPAPAAPNCSGPSCPAALPASVVGACPGGVCPLPASVTGASGDGLDEVNAKRAARGLGPFIRDDGLTAAAHACAAFRARYGLFGHTSNDFGFVPPGCSAASAGCAAYPASYGWMSCCTYDGYTYAGAAYATGADGRRYMHLFVR